MSISDEEQLKVVSLLQEVDQLRARVKFLDDALDLALMGEQIDPGITTARQEIELVYGPHYFTEMIG